MKFHAIISQLFKLINFMLLIVRRMIRQSKYKTNIRSDRILRLYTRVMNISVGKQKAHPDSCLRGAFCYVRCEAHYTLGHKALPGRYLYAAFTHEFTDIPLPPYWKSSGNPKMYTLLLVVS